MTYLDSYVSEPTFRAEKIWWKAELWASMCEIHQGLSPGKRHQLSACIHDHVIIINIRIRGKYMPQNEHGKHGKQKGKTP